MIDSKNGVYIDMGLEKIIKGLKILDKSQLHVGVVGPEAEKQSANGRTTVVEEAVINYYGSTTLGIPRRKFLDIPDEIVAVVMGRVAKAVVNFGDVDAALDEAGERLANIIKERIIRKDFKPNKASTVARKGFNHPLIESSSLLGAISHQIVRENGDAVDAGAAIGDVQGFEIKGGE